MCSVSDAFPPICKATAEQWKPPELRIDETESRGWPGLQHDVGWGHYPCAAPPLANVSMLRRLGTWRHQPDSRLYNNNHTTMDLGDDSPWGGRNLLALWARHTDLTLPQMCPRNRRRTPPSRTRTSPARSRLHPTTQPAAPHPAPRLHRARPSVAGLADDSTGPSRQSSRP